MRSTNSTHPIHRKQISARDSLAEQKRRNEDLQSGLLRIVGAMGMSRSLLQRRDNWDNASRNPQEYEPYRPWNSVQSMIRDVVKTVAERGNDVEHEAVRKAVIAFYETAQRDALEFLGEPSDECVVTLTLESKREVHEAETATIRAIASESPESFAHAAKEQTEAMTLMGRLRDCLHDAGNRLPRHRPHLRALT